MNKLSFYTMLAVLAIPLQANASSCPTTPTCEGLGYTYSESETGQYNFVRCPLDTTRVFYYRPEDIPCSPGMIYDMTVHKCYNEMPTTNIANLYYIVERNGNDGIMLHLNKLGTDSTTKTYGDELKTMASQTIEANSREYFTSEELRKIWGKTPLVSGVASLYAKVGRTFSSVFVKGGIINLNADLSYDFYTRAWSTFSNSNYEYVNKNIFKVPVDLTGASNDTITPATYKVDVEYPLTSREDVGCVWDNDFCSGVKDLNPFYTCPLEAAGLATSKEVKDAFGTQAALKEFLELKRNSGYDAIIFTEDGCIYLNTSSRDVTTVLNSAVLAGYGNNCGAINYYAFCKYTQ